jgi:ribosomal protein S18 acetylase RimI-like enzyme
MGSEPTEASVICAATLRDVAAILEIQRLAGRTASSAASLRATIADPDRLIVVATLGGHTVGWAKTHHWDHPDGLAPAGHYLGGVTVAPESRRRGVGAALTDARMSWIRQRADEAWYVVNSANLASIALHRRWGFEEVARGRRFHTTDFPDDIGVLLRATSA